ncbi:MAG: calmodulin-binding protein [Pirellulaceae bacterium]
MIRRSLLALACAFVFFVCLPESEAAAQQQQAYGRVWGGQYSMRDWDRFYHYPYVTYPQNYWGNEYYRSSESMYYRYPAEMRVPVYNQGWHNYPNPRATTGVTTSCWTCSKPVVAD